MVVEIEYSETWGACPCGVECVRTPTAGSAAREMLKVVSEGGRWALLVTLEPAGTEAFGCALLQHECEALRDYLAWLQGVTVSIRVNGRAWLTRGDSAKSGCESGRALWRLAASDPGVVLEAQRAWELTGIWPSGVPATPGSSPEAVFSGGQKLLETR